MKALLLYLRSSIGKKFIMGLSGLALSGFVLAHMAGNLLIFRGAEAYNHYGHMMTTNPAYPLIAWGLVGAFLVHAGMGIWLYAENKAARKQGYAVTPLQKKDTTLAVKTMMYSGSLVLLFIVLHYTHFKYGKHYTVSYGGLEMRDLHKLIVENFQTLGMVVWYVVSLILLGVHLSHGFQSSFQSIGFNHPKYSPAVKCLSVLYALIVSIGFISQPIYVYFFHR